MPQSNGQVERLNQTMKTILVRQCASDKENWDTYLWKTLLVLRTMKSKATGYSPSEMLYGFQMDTPTSWRPIEESVDLEKEILDRIEKIKNYLPEIREN
ncbi:hypothetical protein AYI69_g7035 [Smittium culicis]|uniref:Integrase catalytic domain-containing protein n=1 Tax=Smittium culicis TaxID=133412 RepID=A0A1R1XV30_9FUNG|nr:hypothetical protein AYI69_g7035 [Smittium culicis]